MEVERKLINLLILHVKRLRENARELMIQMEHLERELELLKTELKEMRRKGNE